MGFHSCGGQECFIHKNNNKKKKSEGAFTQTWQKERTVPFWKTCFCGFRWNNHVQQRNSHTAELHTRPGRQDSRHPEHIWSLTHQTETPITYL